MTTNNSMTVGERLRYVRTTCGFSIAEVSKMINVPEEEILEDERKIDFSDSPEGVTFEHKQWYSALYSCNLNYLMGWCDDPFGVSVREQINDLLDTLTDKQLRLLLQFLTFSYRKN